MDGRPLAPSEFASAQSPRVGRAAQKSAATSAHNSTATTVAATVISIKHIPCSDTQSSASPRRRLEPRGVLDASALDFHRSAAGNIHIADDPTRCGSSFVGALILPPPGPAIIKMTKRRPAVGAESEQNCTHPPADFQIALKIAVYGTFAGIARKMRAVSQRRLPLHAAATLAASKGLPVNSSNRVLS
jgi:hypothetical protein